MMASAETTTLRTDRLNQAIVTMGLSLEVEQRTTLLNYLDELSKWNKTYNLTAIRNAEQALIQHVFDSLSVVKPLKEKLRENGCLTPQIMDVGSGGGLPGVVLAIVMPNAVVTCVDAVEKKISFIRHVTGVLGLKNLKGIHARVENIETTEMDVVISRAFASLKDFAQLSGKHVSAHGELVGMKGKYPYDELLGLDETNWQVRNIEVLTVPELDAERCLVWMKRKG